MAGLGEMDGYMMAPGAEHILRYALGGRVQHFATGGRADRDQQSNHTGDRAQSSMGGGGGGGTGRADRDQQSNRTPDRAQTAMNGGNNHSGAANAGGRALNSYQADQQVQDKYIADPSQHIKNAREYWDAVGNLGSRYKDYKNYGNTAWDNLGNHLLGLVSVGEIDPTQQALGASVNNPNASWGVDPVGLGLTAAGMVTGLPLSSLYDAALGLTEGEGPMIGFDGYNDQSPFSGHVVSPVVGNSGGLGTGTGTSPTGHEHPGESHGLGDIPVTPPVVAPPPVVPVTPPVPVTDPTGRIYQPYGGDWSTYGQQGGTPEWSFYDPVNPAPVHLAGGGGVSFQTKLTPEQESAFKQWKKKYAPDDSGSDYDLRGAFLADLQPAQNGHWSDQFKMPNEPTFSDQSQYAPFARELAGSWSGDTYIPSRGRPGRMADGGPVTGLAGGGKVKYRRSDADRLDYLVNAPDDYLINAPDDYLVNGTGPGGADASVLAAIRGAGGSLAPVAFADDFERQYYLEHGYRLGENPDPHRSFAPPPTLGLDESGSYALGGAVRHYQDGGEVWPSYTMDGQGDALHQDYAMGQHADNTNRAFADAFKANFPRQDNPQAMRQTLVRQYYDLGYPIEDAERAADEMLSQQGGMQGGRAGYAMGGAITGLGGGQDDRIPAMLSDGEHVIDSGTVSAIGAGSNAAGQRKIEQMKMVARKKFGMKKPGRAPNKVNMSALALAS